MLNSKGGNQHGNPFSFHFPRRIKVEVHFGNSKVKNHYTYGLQTNIDFSLCMRERIIQNARMTRLELE